VTLKNLFSVAYIKFVCPEFVSTLGGHTITYWF
jgi:hypothetical protein